MNEATRPCADCGTDISERHWRSKRCHACQVERERLAMNTKQTTRYDKQCEHCGVDFKSTMKDGRFCSRQCSGKATHPGDVARICTVCDSEFTISRQFDRPECSKPCAAWRRRNPSGKPPTTCKWCGESLAAPRSGRRWRTLGAELCDDKCWHAYEAGISWESIRDRRCVVCDQPMPRTMHLHRVVCSDACRTRNRSIEVLFRQTHARRKRLDEASLTYRVPKRVIYALRRLPCIYCGGPGGTVDHVIPLARGGHHAEGNLVPACRSCNTSKAGRLLAEWRYLPPHRSRAPRRLPWLTSHGYLHSSRPTG